MILGSNLWYRVYISGHRFGNIAATSDSSHPDKKSSRRRRRHRLLLQRDPILGIGRAEKEKIGAACD